MPIYEYRCRGCGRKNEFITFRVSEVIGDLACKYCGSRELDRLISRVRVRLSEETRLERLADPAKWGSFDENDPKSVEKFMKTMGREIGDDLETDIDELIEESMEEGFAASDSEGEESSANEASL
ncbi:MAG: zinc ribbon domain-containing protein [Deltaproteobacteria bacterium]|nr:zinc ribbon domain-containing protein [Deltaproteobacteria bacterium]MBW2068128.1 zinc ribbon domain-containing protein [Deltaproteobacteria bacterium]